MRSDGPNAASAASGRLRRIQDKKRRKVLTPLLHHLHFSSSLPCLSPLSTHRQHSIRIEKMPTLVISVNLECSSCKAKIKKVLECLQGEYCIENIEYDEKKNKVIVRGKFDAQNLCKKIWCKAGMTVKEIEIVQVCPPPPEPWKCCKCKPVCPPPTKPCKCCKCKPVCPPPPPPEKCKCGKCEPPPPACDCSSHEDCVCGKPPKCPPNWPPPWCPPPIWPTWPPWCPPS